MILKMKTTNFSVIKPDFLGDVDVDNILVSNNICSGEKNYKHFINYLHGDYNIKQLHKMLPKMKLIENVNVKS